MCGYMSKPRPALTHQAIAESALDILRQEGPDALSFRRVAEILGTYHVLVFRRCGGMDGLLDICADYASAEFPLVPDSVDWVDATQARFEAAYGMFAEHASLILLMRGRPWLGFNITERFYEPTMRSFLEAGMTAEEASGLFSILYRLTIGSVISLHAHHWIAAESAESVQRHGGAEHFPSLVKINSEVDNSNLLDVYRGALRTLISHLAPNRNAAT